MVKGELCHGVLDEEAHNVPKKSHRVQFYPIPVQDARERISQIHRQQNLPEEALPSPWVHPDFGCAYAEQSHVLLGGPEEIPKCEHDTLWLCNKHYKQQGATTVWLAFNSSEGWQARRGAPAAVVADVEPEVRAYLRALSYS